MKITTTLSLSFLLGSSYLPAAMAQQVTGTPGSPSATTTIQGNQIPPPPPKFGGVIKENATDSKTWWPPNVVPPKGAPNVLLIMTDDQGYGVSGTLGFAAAWPAQPKWVASRSLKSVGNNATQSVATSRRSAIRRD